MLNKEEYASFVSERAPKSKHVKTCVAAFFVGGLICCIGQGVQDVTKMILPEYSIDKIQGITTIVMIFLGALLTGFGWYDKIGDFAGGGSIVPITGFANSIVAPAMEFKKEGVILGICAKMFTVAGPIIVLGVFASFISGILALIF